MPECSKCGTAVHVPAGYEFDEGDMCFECEIADLRQQLAEAKALIAAADKLAEAVEGDNPIFMAQARDTYLSLKQQAEKGV